MLKEKGGLLICDTTVIYEPLHVFFLMINQYSVKPHAERDLTKGKRYLCAQLQSGT